MPPFIRGQKSKLSDLTPATTLEVGIQVAARSGQSIDISCFGLDEAGKLSDDRYFVFYNQTASPCGSIRAQGAGAGESERFVVNLPGLPSTIRRLVFTATLDDDAPGSLSAIGPSYLVVRAQGAEVARFAFSGADFGGERAVMIAELYFKDVWRFAAVGQGFNGGLAALLKHFGGEVATPAKAVAPPPVSPKPPAPPPVPAAPKVSLGKMTLEKRGEKRTLSLTKGGGGANPIHVNLNWDDPDKAKRGGFFSGMFASPPPDLDLGCMWRLRGDPPIPREILAQLGPSVKLHPDDERELKNMLRKGVIQPLGNKFGSRTEWPFIHLDKDDRTGAAADGENLYLLRPEMIDKVVIFALIYEGAAKFTDVNARLTLKDHNGAETIVKLDNPDASRKFCAICVIERHGEELTVMKDERYFHDHEECDNHYGFGFKWKAGSK